jgi:hypothetical protein
MSPEQLSRRKAIAALSATAAVVLAGDRSANRKPAFHGRTENCAGPTYSATGPNAELYGADEGYPLPDVMEARRRGDPWEPKYRVAAFSHLDQIYPTRFSRKPIFTCRLSGTQCNHRPVDRQGRSYPLRAISICPNRPRPVRVPIHGQVHHRAFDRHRRLRGSHRVGR